MSGGAETILFEAVSHPPAGLTARGMRWLAGLALGAAAIPAVLFTLLGAWPVLGFLGAEVGLVLFLVALHRSWSRSAEETVRIAGGRLQVRRRDGRGGQEAVELDAYWSRLEIEERPGAVPVLRAVARGDSVELGRFLSAEEKLSLAEALDAALRYYRSPSFDNPQLRS
ncbi:DUF2244 domain-containing protein [Falsiroseomonas sp. HW251]|uniref:DUF2244 domain-containing protein n=1 Tax=Falsiroseomonas sp. HW251 TaxID=3390998 RepID=UPI003D314F94